MKLGRSACFATLVAFSAWFAACSSDTTTGSGDGGPDSSSGGSGGGSGGKAGSGGSGASAGKAGAGGSTGGAAGAAGSAGKAGAAGAAGSAGSPSVDGGNDGGLPSIKITSPANGATINIPAGGDPDVPVAFTVANFVLKDAGSTGCPAGSCGHVHLLIDGASCNDNTTPTAIKPYNNFGFMSPINAGFDYCPMEAGMHTVTLELRNNDHSALKPPVTDSIKVTIVLGGDGGAGDAGPTKDGG